MTRCSYISPEGQSVIAIAKERGGTTDGDIEALIDRFGCKAEATRIIGRAGSTAIDAHACDDHVGHLLGEAPCAWVESVGSAPPPGWDEPADVTVTLTSMPAGVSSADFVPTILSPSPTTTPVVDLGTNPTREQVRAAGFDGDSAAYREALAKLREIKASRKPVAIETWPLNMTLSPLPPDDRIEKVPCRADDEVGAFVPMTINERSVGVARPVELVPANRPTDENTMCPAALGIGSSMHTYIRGAERCFCGKHSPPPYAPGDAVEWRTGPLDNHWRTGRVTSVVDDRPNDGIDKPCWRVRVDTAGERSFLSSAVIATCLRPATSAAATASALCNALLSTVCDVTAVCLVEHTDAEFEVFVDGGEPDDIARCIYDNMPVYIALRGQESGDGGDGTRVAFSRGAMEAAVAYTPPRVRRCTFAGLGGAR